MIYRIILALLLTGLVEYCWVIPSPAPKPFVYRYQWPGEFGDQRMTICISKGHGFDCRASRTSDEL